MRKSMRFRFSKKNRKRMKTYFQEYCDNTSLHGFKYLSENKRSWLEKFWWFITISTCVSLCGYLTLKTYYKWMSTPVIVSFATKQTPIFEIPFPAVTVCPEAKLNASVFNYSEHFDDWGKNKDVQKKLEYLSLICIPPNNTYGEKYWSDESPLNFLNESAPDFNQVFINCEYGMKEKRSCSNLFKPVFTDEGVCYTFNMIDRKDIFTDKVLEIGDYFRFRDTKNYDIENGYNKYLSAYPKRALYTGAKYGLKVTLKSDGKSQDRRCGDSLKGYKIILHHPTELPRSSQQYFRLPLKQAVVAAITPHMMITKSALQSYNYDRRQCYFQTERQLKYFKIYNQANCELECLTDYIENMFGCVNFYMPRMKNVKICLPANQPNITIAEKALMIKEIAEMLREQEETDSNANFMLKLYNFIKPEKHNETHLNRCNCLPACTSINYNTETSQSEFYYEDEQLKRNKTSSSNDSEEHSMLIVYFKEYQFIPSERNELYGIIDFAASIGGLLGLFIGSSVISIMEIIYFLTLRWCCNIALSKKCCEPDD